MRCVIRIPAAVWHATTQHLLAVPVERLAYLLARASVWVDPWDGPTTDLLVRQALLVPEAALAIQTSVRVEVDPQFTRAVLLCCYETGLSLVDVHTHPFAGDQVSFSSHDIANMRETHAEFRRQIPQAPPAVAASLVIGQRGVAGAWLDPDHDDITSIRAVRLVAQRHEEVTLCAA
jgi:hypothetical protein